MMTANLEDVKKKATSLTELAFSARHYGISVWVICQKYNSIVKDFRENIRCWFSSSTRTRSRWTRLWMRMIYSEQLIKVSLKE